MLRLFIGDNLVRMEEAVAELVGSLEPAGSGVNVLKFEGAEAQLQNVVMACQSAPLIGPKRAIIVRGLAGRLQSAEGATRNAFLDAVRTLPASTELIILEPGWKELPSAHPLWEVAQAVGEARLFSLATGDDAIAWVQERFASQNVIVDARVALELLRRVGMDSVQLCSEIDKLVTLSLPSRRLTVEDVQALVPRTVEGSVFSLVDALAQRASARALQLAEELMQTEGEGLSSAIALLGRQFRNLLAVKEMLSDRKSAQEMKQLLGIPPWQLRRLVAQCRHFSVDGLEQAIMLTVATDLRAKMSSTEPAQLLVELVAKILTPDSSPQMNGKRSDATSSGSC